MAPISTRRYWITPVRCIIENTVKTTSIFGSLTSIYRETRKRFKCGENKPEKSGIDIEKILAKRLNVLAFPLLLS